MTKKKDFPMDVMDSAHKVWLAGLGAVSVAEQEGSKFFKRLVKKGEKFEAKRKEQVDTAFDRVKDSVKEGVEDVRDEVESRWQRLGDSFDRKVGRAVERLGVPSREEISKLTQRVEDLTAKLDDLQKAKTPTPKTRTPKTRTPKTATSKTARKTAVRKSA